MKRLILVLIILFTVPAAAHSAIFDPSFDFRTIETEHFRIHYHQGLEQMGRRAAVTAEEVHQKLSPLLQWVPEEKTNIVIADNSDFANGMTTVVPYNAIYLQTTPPSFTSSLGEYDNWLRLLIVHEYAHVLTSDPVRGYRKAMRMIFGKIVPLGDLLDFMAFAVWGPSNMLMPRWWHEGMATWAETELTSSGRGRNSYYQMLYRTAVAENNLLPIDRINGEIPYWPEGNAPYIFGSRLIQYIAQTYGAELPGNISWQQAGRIPYFINGTTEEQLGGKNYSDLYKEMLASINRAQQEKIAILKSEKLTGTRRVGNADVSETNPRFSPDGKMLAFNRNDRHSHPTIVIQDSNGKEIANFWTKYGDGVISWSPDNRYIYFCQAENSYDSNFYQDIYRYDVKRSSLKRLTKGIRAIAPDVSPDGRTLVVVINSRGGQNLALLDLQALVSNDDAKPKFITDFKEFSLSAPRWSPDGKHIAYAMKDAKGIPSLNLLTLATSENRELYSSAQTVDSPVWSPDGSTLLFTSDENGVFNIHSYNLSSEETVQVTHLLSGAFSPDIRSTDGTLAISEYTSNGFVVSLIARENLRTSEEPAPAISSIVYPVKGSLLEPSETASPASTEKEAPYSPLSSLLPKFWLPAMIAETSEDSAVGAVTAGQDLLGYHTIFGKVLYGSAFDKAYYEALYQYGRFIPTFSLHGYALPTTYTDLLPSRDYNEIERGLITTMRVPLGRNMDSPLYFNAGYHLRDQKALAVPAVNTFNGRPVFQGRRDSYFAGLDYFDQYRYPWSVTTEQGRTLSFNFEYFGRESGSDLETKEYKASWTEYFSLWNNHNIMARASGGLAEGEQAPQGSFQLGGVTSFLNPFGLRGYDSRFTAGSRVATGTLEYRFPINYFLRGFGTAPLFLDRLHGAIFLDAGETWDKQTSFESRDIMLGTGAEIRFDVTLGYWLKVTPAIGYAHGFDRNFGTDQVYFMVYTNL